MLFVIPTRKVQFW